MTDRDAREAFERFMEEMGAAAVESAGAFELAQYAFEAGMYAGKRIGHAAGLAEGAAQEREACARICDDKQGSCGSSALMTLQLARLIRARGEKGGK